MNAFPDDWRDLDMPAEQVAELLEINTTENAIETVMRMRALIELSALLDTETLIGLAGVAKYRRRSIRDFVFSFTHPPH